MTKISIGLSLDLLEKKANAHKEQDTNIILYGGGGSELNVFNN